MLTQIVLLAVAPFVAAFTYPDAVPLEKRQQPGTPQYDCHAACGAVISGARTENFCDSSNFTSSLDECLDCANEFDIWRYYGESVAEAAESCGLNATPAPANATTSSTASADDDAASSTTPSSSTATETVEPTSADASTSASATESPESAAESAASETSSGAATAATSSEGLGFAVLPGMVQVGLGIGAVMLV